MNNHSWGREDLGPVAQLEPSSVTHRPDKRRQNFLLLPSTSFSRVDASEQLKGGLIQRCVGLELSIGDQDHPRASQNRRLQIYPNDGSQIPQTLGSISSGMWLGLSAMSFGRFEEALAQRRVQRPSCANFAPLPIEPLR